MRISRARYRTRTAKASRGTAAWPTSLSTLRFIPPIIAGKSPATCEQQDPSLPTPILFTRCGRDSWTDSTLGSELPRPAHVLRQVQPFQHPNHVPADIYLIPLHPKSR